MPRLSARPRSRWIAPGRLVTGLLAAGLLVSACILGWPQLHRRLAAAGSDPAAARRSSAAPPAAARSGGAGPTGTPANAAHATARPDAGLARSDAEQLAAGESVTDGQAGGTRDTQAGGSSGGQAGIRTAADAARVLAQLAAVRERAYAQRRPDLLAGVYSSASLLAADTQQLYRSVPEGCSLSGVHASYRELSLGVGAGTRSVQVGATVSLPAAVLSCGPAMRGQTRPTGPLRLRLVLADEGRGWRIRSERAG
jgi:hypothetical protein